MIPKIPVADLIAAAQRYRIDAGALGQAIALGVRDAAAPIPSDAIPSETIVTRTINSTGRAEIAAFLGEHHAAAVASGEGASYFSASMLDAWCADAEFQLAEGNGASIEILARDSASGHTVMYSVSASGVSSEIVIDGSGVEGDGEDAVTCELDLDAVRGASAPLFVRYPGQVSAQPAHLEIDPGSRTYTAESNPEIGNAVPMDVWHRRRLRCGGLPPSIGGAALAGFLADPDLVDLITRVCDGHSDAWDGSNMIGRLTDDASDALQDIERMIDALAVDLGASPDGLAWEAVDYVDASDWEALWPHHLTLAQAAEAALAEAPMAIAGDLDAAMLNRAAQMHRSDDVDRLAVTHLDALLEDGLIRDDQYWQWIAEAIDSAAEAMAALRPGLADQLSDLADRLRD